MQQNYGSKCDVLDHRDMIRMCGAGEIPSNPKHGLVKCVHHVYDQARLDCCLPNVLCSTYRLKLMRQSMESNNTFKYFVSSGLFLYYNSRLYDMTTDQNVDVAFRDFFKSMKRYGVCTEVLWPYDEQKFSKKTLSSCYQNGFGNYIVKYAHLQ